MSRRLLPKKFLPLLGERTLCQQTVLRAQSYPGCAAPVVVANAEHRFLAAEQLQAIGVKAGALILEPSGRSTAPAVAAAALQVQQEDPDAVLLVLPSDHLLRDLAAFHDAVRRAIAAAAEGFLVTFGVAPTHPATGYGYIEMGDALGEATCRIRRFIEKPGLEKAREFLLRDSYLWNSGMFVFGARRYAEELAALQPGIPRDRPLARDKANRDLDFLRLDADAFGACPAVSVDYGIMERTRSGAVV